MQQKGQNRNTNTGGWQNKNGNGINRNGKGKGGWQQNNGNGNKSRNQNPGTNGNSGNNKNNIFCKYCQRNNHDSADCTNNHAKTSWRDAERKKAGNKGFCNTCEISGHSTKKCTARKSNEQTGKKEDTEKPEENPINRWCPYCNTSEHTGRTCGNDSKKATYYSSELICTKCCWKGHEERHCNNPLPGTTCYKCKQSGHSSDFCNGIEQNVEKLWCKFCNTVNHNTRSCSNKASRQNYHASDGPGTRCGRCFYSGHSTEACNNPRPESTCEVCFMRGHVADTCEMARLRKVETQRRRVQINKTLNHGSEKTPGFNDLTQIIRVPADRVEDMVPVVMRAGHERIIHNGNDLTRTCSDMLINNNTKQYNYYYMPWTVHCLDAEFDLYCGVRGCDQKCNVVDHNLDVVMKGIQAGYSTDTAWNYVFAETSCHHGSTPRQMIWSRKGAYGEVIRQAAQTLLAHHHDPIDEVTRMWVNEVRVHFADTRTEHTYDAGETDEARKDRHAGLNRTQHQRESLQNFRPGCLPRKVDELDGEYDREGASDRTGRRLADIRIDPPVDSMDWIE